MLATLALTLMIARPQPAVTTFMASKMAIAAQQYGDPPAAQPTAIPETHQANSRALYLSPTDDIWVYAHAEDPQKDEFLRAWGAGGHAIGLPGDDPNSYSWSLLRWDLSGFPAKSRVATAELVLTAAPEAGYTEKDAAAAPLEVRPVKGGFSEKDWDFVDAIKYTPTGTEADVYGSSSPTVVTPTEFKIVIDLLKGPADFKALFNAAMKGDHQLALALASKIDPQTLGMKGVYKVYSKDASDPSVRPALRIVLENPPK